MEQFHGTTIVSVRRGDKVALGGDGQVTLGNIVMKGGARKVRRIYNNQVLVGFAGGTADAFSLLDRFEAKLEKHQGNLTRAAVELAKDWRTDRMLRRLEAMLITADATTTLVITGNGDVLDPEEGICAIGSGVRMRRRQPARSRRTPSCRRARSSRSRSRSPATCASTRTTTASSKRSSKDRTMSTMTLPRSSRNSTSTSSARRRRRRPSRSRCATAGAASRSPTRCARKSRRRTS